MDAGWHDETAAVAAAFDRVADLYRAEFVDELDRKPFDCAFLRRVAALLPRDRAALEVGAGPAHIARFLQNEGVPMVASDASFGQLCEARGEAPGQWLVAADLAVLPFRAGYLGGLIAFYCLIYGPASRLNNVFAHWHRALAAGGVVAIAVHAGAGTIDMTEWQGRRVGITVVLRDPDDVTKRLESNGFIVRECTTRSAYADEHSTDRCYIIAERS